MSVARWSGWIPLTMFFDQVGLLRQQFLAALLDLGERELRYPRVRVGRAVHHDDVRQQRYRPGVHLGCLGRVFRDEHF
jgi:hypothetical protein